MLIKSIIDLLKSKINQFLQLFHIISPNLGIYNFNIIYCSNWHNLMLAKQWNYYLFNCKNILFSGWLRSYFHQQVRSYIKMMDCDAKIQQTNPFKLNDVHCCIGYHRSSLISLNLHNTLLFRFWHIVKVTTVMSLT